MFLEDKCFSYHKGVIMFNGDILVVSDCSKLGLLHSQNCFSFRYLRKNAKR